MVGYFRMSDVLDWDELGPNDLHHHSRSENHSDSIGRSRLKARLFQGHLSDSQTPHTTYGDVSSGNLVSQPSPGVWEEHHIQVQKERNLRLKAQKAAFEARDKILELSVKLNSAECDARMWKEAATQERENKEKAEKERDMAHVSSLALESKVKASQQRIAQFESETKQLLERILEIQEDRDTQGNLLQQRTEQCSQLRVEIANQAASLEQRSNELKRKDSHIQSLEQSIEIVRRSCRDAEENLRAVSERRDELEVICERNTTRTRNLEASVSTHATRLLVIKQETVVDT